MAWFRLIGFFLLGVFLSGPVYADIEPADLVVPVEMDFNEEEPYFSFSLTESIPGDHPLEIYRKPVDEESWNKIHSSFSLHQEPFIDEDVETGKKYEYRFIKPLPDTQLVARTYIEAGVQVPPDFQKGTTLLLVELSLLNQLQNPLIRFKADLAGDGWTIVREAVSSGSSVEDIKKTIKDVRSELSPDQPKLKNVILIGDIPVPYSGDMAPDLQANHEGAWPADAYYADFSEEWTDEEVNNISADRPENHNVPGDGKFDQNTLPGEAELSIGRIDLSGIAEDERNSVAMLFRYFQKNHDYRHKNFSINNEALIQHKDPYPNFLPGRTVLSNFYSLVGADSIQEGSFFPALEQDNYALAYGSGRGDFSSAPPLGNYEDFLENETNAVFNFMFGPYFGDWDSDDNLLRSALATEGNTLVSAWLGWPHWALHTMGLGSTIGEALVETQNNKGNYGPDKGPYQDYQRGTFLSIHGDPTLTLHQVDPPSAFSASYEEPEDEVLLTWAPSEDDDIIGYHLFRSNSLEGPYERITEEPLNRTGIFHSYEDTGEVYYKVRGVKLQETPTGSYYNLTQGLIDQAQVATSANPPPPEATNLQLYPNPVAEELHIAFPERIAFPVEALILDKTGREVKSMKVPQTNNEASLDISDLEVGFYQLIIVRDNGQKVGQESFMKQQ